VDALTINLQAQPSPFIWGNVPAPVGAFNVVDESGNQVATEAGEPVVADVPKP